MGRIGNRETTDAAERTDARSGGASSPGVTPWYVARPVPEGGASGPQPRRGTVLIIDDTPDNVALLAELLEALGYHVLSALDGPSGLRLLASSQVDVVLLDLLMPGMDGFQVLDERRSIPGAAELPVVVISALSSPEHVVKALQCGATDYVTKPLEFEVVAARLHVHMQAKQSRDQLKRHDALHKDFIRIAGHDLRSPMMAVSLNLQLLLRRLVSSGDRELRTFAERALRNAQFSMDLLENLVELVNLGGDVHALQIQPVDAQRLLDDVTQRHAARAVEKSVSLRQKVGQALGVIQADNIRLQQALNNLVSNALKFTPSGGSIELVAARAAPGLVVEVVDTGLGIPADKQQRLFDGLRLGGPATAGEKSTGLGLLIAKRIIDLHGGKLTIESEEGRGTRARLVVPDPLRTA